MNKAEAQKAARRFAAALRIDRTLTTGRKNGKPITEKKKETLIKLLHNTKKKIV